MCYASVSDKSFVKCTNYIRRHRLYISETSLNWHASKNGNRNINRWRQEFFPMNTIARHSQWQLSDGRSYKSFLTQEMELLKWHTAEGWYAITEKAQLSIVRVRFSDTNVHWRRLFSVSITCRRDIPERAIRFDDICIPAPGKHLSFTPQCPTGISDCRRRSNQTKIAS